MRIRSVHIGSFGKIKDFSIEDLPEGLVLIIGDNESGKTTMMEFMRTTMFPSSRRSSYPSASKTDCGSMELVTDSGDAMNLLREQKKISEVLGRKLPSELFQMDSDTYNSIFAMTLEDLTNEDAISSERIRNRFLTIPGGEKVPSVLKTVSSLKRELMNDERLTDRNPIGALRNELSELDRRIISAKETMLDYDILADEMRSIESEITEAEAIRKNIERERARRELLESQRNNIGKMIRLRSERKDLEYASAMPDDVPHKHRAAEERIRRLEGMISDIGDIEAISEDELMEMKTFGRELALFSSGYDRMRDRIESLKDSIAEDEEEVDEIGIPKELTEKGSIKELERIANRKVPAASIAAFIAAAVLFVASMIYDVLIAAGGVLMLMIAVLLIVSNRGSKQLTRWMTSHGLQAMKSYQVQTLLKRIESAGRLYERISDNTAELQTVQNDIEEIEAKARSILNKEGIEYYDPEQASEALQSSIKEKEGGIAAARKISVMNEDIASAISEIQTIESAYGGKAGFIKTREDRSELDRIDQELKVLGESVVSSTGLDPAEAEAELNSMLPEIRTYPNISDLNIRKGETRMRMDAILSSVDLNGLLMERSSKRNELIQKVREWGILSIQGTLIDLSCTELYRKMQPAVITTANRYLSMMTGDRYRIDADPRIEGIVIMDSLNHKTSDQWSSGLGDQVYLSIKMAIAKEMGSEHLPMILDDILVRFDRKRRKGACKAILDFAKDQQAFLFSCDSSVQESFPAGSRYALISFGDQRS